MCLFSEREALVSGYIGSFGLSIPPSAGAVDWADLKARRDAYVANLNKNYEINWSKAGIDIVVGTASFDGPHTVRVVPSEGGEAQVLHAARVCIAVGGMPAQLRIPGGELAINSDDFFDLETQPKRVAVIGAGYIAVEVHAHRTSRPNPCSCVSDRAAFEFSCICIARRRVPRPRHGDPPLLSRPHCDAAWIRACPSALEAPPHCLPVNT